MQKDDFLPEFSKCIFISSSVAENDKKGAESREYEKEEEDESKKEKKKLNHGS